MRVGLTVWIDMIEGRPWSKSLISTSLIPIPYPGPWFWSPVSIMITQQTFRDLCVWWFTFFCLTLQDCWYQNIKNRECHDGSLHILQNSVRGVVQKWDFYGQADHKGWLPPPSPYCQTFVIFFVCVSPLYDIMIMCVLKRILHKNKVTFIQLFESPIPPYCWCSVTKWSDSSIQIFTFAYGQPDGKKTAFYGRLPLDKLNIYMKCR